MTYIVGAGLSGLIAGHVIKDAEILERNPRGQMHGALLRFRSDVVAEATGIPFKKVQVRKGIHFGDHGFVQPNIAICNSYSVKVTGKLGDRSIWNMDPVERFIAPDSFYDRMVDQLGDRVKFEEPLNLKEAAECDGPMISTAPLPTMLDELGVDRQEIAFDYQNIFTMQIHINNADAYQTIYFPNGDHGLYRASITGSTLILEFVNNLENEMAWINELCGAFSFTYAEVEPFIREQLIAAEMQKGIVRTQKYGKIVPLPSGVRRSLMLYLTAQFGIYSIGRFATWRNILLDDLVKDAHRVLDMMKADDYHTKLTRGQYARHTD